MVRFLENSNNLENPLILLNIDKIHANDCLNWLRSNDLLNYEYGIMNLNEKILIPICNEVIELPDYLTEYEIEIIEYPSDQLEEEMQIQIQKQLKKSKKLVKQIPKLYKALEDQIPAEIIDQIPRSYDIIGSIAILELNRQTQEVLQPYINLIGSTLLNHHSALTSVFMKAGDVSGIYRTRPLVCIAGTDNPITIHKENNCQFQLDITRTFFTPRLVYERKRIMNLQMDIFESGLTWDVFCGVGPFLIEIAKQNPQCSFIGTDINPDAVFYAQNNLILNKIKASTTIFESDVAAIENSSLKDSLIGQTTRLIMNLPEHSLEYLSSIKFALHSNGALLHIYQFNDKDDPLQDAETQLINALSLAEIKLEEILHRRVVKPFSPAFDMTVIDAIIK